MKRLLFLFLLIPYLSFGQYAIPFPYQAKYTVVKSGKVNLSESGDVSNGQPGWTDIFESVASTPVAINTTGWSVSLTVGTGTTYISFPASVYGNAIFSDNILGKFWFNSNAISTLTITGLNIAKTYTVVTATAAANAPSGGDGFTTVTVGSATPQVTGEPTGTVAYILTFTAVAPDGSGHLTISWNGPNFPILNAFTINENFILLIFIPGCRNKRRYYKYKTIIQKLI